MKSTFDLYTLKNAHIHNNASNHFSIRFSQHGQYNRNLFPGIYSLFFQRKFKLLEACKLSSNELLNLQ